MAGSELCCLARPSQSFLFVSVTQAWPALWVHEVTTGRLWGQKWCWAEQLCWHPTLTSALHTDRGAAALMCLNYRPSPQCHKTFTAPSVRSQWTWHWTSCTKGLRSRQPLFRTETGVSWTRGCACGISCSWFAVCLSVCAIPSLLCSSTHSSGTAAPQALGTSGLASQEHQRFLCLCRALLLEDVPGFVLIKAEESSATIFQATHCLWGERHLKNSLIYHVKKRWHIYCYINVIYIVFSVTLTEIFWTSCCWLERFISNTLKFDTGYKSAINQQWKLENKMRSNSSRTISSYNTP